MHYRDRFGFILFPCFRILKKEGLFYFKYTVYRVKKYLPCKEFFLKVYKCSWYGGVGVLGTHTIFMISVELSSPAAQELSQELLVCSLQHCTWGKFIGTIPGNAGKSYHVQLPFAGGSDGDEVTEAHQRKIHILICSPYAGPVLSAVASTWIPVRCSQIYFYQFLGWKVFSPPLVCAVTSPPSWLLSL